MSRVATCAKCGGRVTVPEGIGQDEPVRCPLCSGECPVGEVLADVGEAVGAATLPPELVPIAAVEAQGQGNQPLEAEKEAGPEQPADQTQSPLDEAQEPGADGEEALEEAEEPPPERARPVAKTEGSLDEDGEAAGEDEVVRVRCPCCDAEYALSEAIVAATGAALGDAATALTRDGAPRGAGASADRTPALEVWQKVDAVPQIEVRQRGGPQAVEADAAAFDFGDAGTEATDAAAIAAGRRPGRRGKRKSALRTILGPVLGGIGGLLIAYYILNLWRGDQFDILEIPLPGVPHTYEHSPDWFPSWLKPDSDPEDTESNAASGFQVPKHRRLGRLRAHEMASPSVASRKLIPTRQKVLAPSPVL